MNYIYLHVLCLHLHKRIFVLDLNTVCSYSDDSEHDSVEVAQVFNMSDSSEIAKCSNKPNKVNGKTKFIDDRMLACMDAGSMSSPFAIHFISATAKALGHDLKDLVLNCTSLRKQRKEYRRRQCKQIMESFEVIKNNFINFTVILITSFIDS